MPRRLELSNRLAGSFYISKQYASFIALLTVPLLAACGTVETNQTFPNPDTTREVSQSGALEEFQFQIWGGQPDETQAAMQERRSADLIVREEWIAACMAEKGFTYIPSLALAPTITFIEHPIDVHPGSREFAERYGFGISEDLTTGAIVESLEGVQNPNDDLQSAMSPAELLAWQDALWGTNGCSNTAFRVLFEPIEFSALSSEIGILWYSISTESPPAFAALNGEWATCMAIAGFPNSQSPRLLEQLLREDFARLRGQTVEVGYPRELDAQASHLFAQHEISAAVADFDCRYQLSYDERHKQINHAMQQEFVNQHRNELEAWAEHAESLRAGP